MTKLGEDLKKIVGIKEVINRLKTLEEKQPIQSITTTVWTDSNGNIKTSQLGVGEDALGQAGSGSYQSAADAALAAISGNAYNAVPGQGGVTRGATDGIKNIIDLLDGVDDVQLSPDASGNPLMPLTTTNEILAGVSGLQDCDNPDYGVTVYLSDQYPPPTGWTTADSGGPPLGFTSGFYWEDRAFPIANHTDAGAAAEASYHYEQFVGAASLRENYRNLNITVVVPNVSIDYDFDYWSGGILYTDGHVSGSLAGVRNTCGGVSDYCPATDPVSYIFPISLTRSIAKNSDGNFVSHDNERPVPTTFKQPKSTVVYCTSVGRMVRFSPNKIGGTNIVEIDSGTGAPTGVARIFRKDGSLAGYSDTTGLLNYEM